MLQEDKTTLKANVKNSNGTVEKKLRNKQFVQRDSVLTDIFQKNYGLYHMFIVAITLFWIKIAMRDFSETGTINFAFSRIKSEFQYFHYALVVVLLMFIPTFGLYLNFQFWAKMRYHLQGKVSMMWDHFWLMYYIIYQILFLLVFGYLIKKIGVGVTLSFALYCEQVRHIMKTHSFVRNKVPIVFASRYSQGDQKYQVPVTFSKYFYFLFAPTLIYEDNYPRKENINWRFVFTSILEIILIVPFCIAIVDEYIPYFNTYGLKYSDANTLIINYFRVVSSVFLIAVFLNYFLLHAWSNVWGELLRFGDRLFYEDWWNCHTYDQFYKKWNAVVHDWCYLYIYKDLRYICTNNSMLPLASVFFASALIHDYVIILSTVYTFPFLFCFYTITSIPAIHISNAFNKNLGNLFFLYTYFSTTSVFIFFYTIEYFAEKNCPAVITDNIFLRFIRPNFLNCPTI